MRAGSASKTAELVCMGRALAHGAPGMQFEDPTAFALLPRDAQTRVANYRANAPAQSLRARLFRVYLQHQSSMMVARTLAIDSAIRAAAAPQLVILGAGLDGRAFRMPELRDVIVFEVDHPDSQRDKRARLASLKPTARDVRFVPVDFERDALHAALERAGHDRTRATTWVWEGVVMYLTPEDVEATLRVVAQRSAPGSRLIILYHSPALLLKLVGLFVSRLGEPLRSAYRPDVMRALLERHGFAVIRDDALPTLGAKLSKAIADSTRRMKHMRIVSADRPA